MIPSAAAVPRKSQVLITSEIPQNEGKNATLIKGNLLEKIPFLNKPLAQGGELSFLTHAEFKERFGCEYTESLFVSQEDLAGVVANVTTDEGALSALKEAQEQFPWLTEEAICYRLENPFEDVAICYVNPEVGYGLSAIRNIQAFEILFCYSGVVTPQNSLKNNDYAFNWAESVHQQSNNYYVDARNHRGLAAFMLHLPFGESTELKYGESSYKTVGDIENAEQLTLKPGIKIEIATRNLKFDTFVMPSSMGEVPVLVAYTVRTVQAGEQLGYPHGWQYWKIQGKLPSYFDLEGNVIDPSSYTHSWQVCLDETKQQLKDPAFLYRQGAKRLKIQNYPAAQRCFTLASELFLKKTQKGEEKKKEIGFCCLGIGTCLQRLGKIQQAMAVFADAIWILEDLAPAEAEKAKEKLQKLNELQKASEEKESS